LGLKGLVVVVVVVVVVCVCILSDLSAWWLEAIQLLEDVESKTDMKY
jgi:hypothetical protein